MKNKFLLILAFLAFSFSLTAQDFNKQYSVKATTWLENKLELSSSPYQITVKTLGEESNKRFAIGTNLSANYAGSLATNLNLSLRFGKERFIDFGKNNKWRFLYGLDYLGSAGTSLSGNFRVGILSLGVSPFAGLQYRINKRLVVFTETSYELRVLGSTSDRRTFQANFGSRFRPLGSIWLGFELFKPKKNK